MSENGGNNENKLANRIIPVDIEAEMKQSFIDYAMSVIVDRALPDVRDGLKPVHRRILYAMHLLGFSPDKPHRKCATTVGEVLGKFHPHGDAAVYDSLVRMAQDFSLRYPLIDGHGNFGSVDGDAPAAMRYTEARLSKIAMEMLRDINKDTVDFKPNFDEHEIEPVVLPSRFPNLLVNGSSGIAVGMATNIPPHNLTEIIDGIIKTIDNPDITIDELNETIKGPDFPTGGSILGKSGIREAYQTGKGRIIVRAVTEIEQYAGNRQRIIVTELPYQVNKARLIERIAQLVKDKKIEGISDLRDESDRNGMRIVIELKRDANAQVVLNRLYSFTQMQDTFNVNMLALIQTPEGKFEPKVLNLKEAIVHYIRHQEDVIRRRTRYDLEKAEARAHILEGLKIAIDNLDEVISIIKGSKTEAAAKENLMNRFSLSEKQAQAIVDMRLGRLTALELEKLEAEYQDLLQKIAYYRDVLAKPELVAAIIKDELTEIKQKYGDERRTSITAEESEIDMEDLIKDEPVVVTLTRFGYIKRTSSDAYRSQKRGGKGISGITTREDDFVVDMFTTTTHQYLMFFTNKGRAYKLRAWQIPEAGRQARGTAIVNLLELEPDEKINAFIRLNGNEKDAFLVMATRKGMIKKTPLGEYSNVRKSGIQAITLREGDELIETRLTDGNEEIMLITRNGMCIRFHEKDVRPMGRTSMGVIGIRLDEDDEVIAMLRCVPNTTLLVVTQNGFGKRTELEEYKVQARGGKGILTYRVTEKTGPLIGAVAANEDDDLLLISTDGTIIRIHVEEISILSRVTQGVTLMRTSEDNRVVSLARLTADVKREHDEQPEDENASENGDGDSEPEQEP
ncbi:DNA gyrase subunit A [Thermoclostridium caenicola]|uniref:DNA gyrase subunit A n=1 Tax=Thermoclostridium caenicola TaxID=659425 RepID=A0A1M6J9C9_9FIRM|nr:DNA gyrase subunit A [Thermoclostridium caenicola]SHJ43336.1 DNA gyrase subunit A [Thermoclostridium caenicola]HOL84273.1 DNA gyrase subunit A [Thermoclostridium caenicola]HPO76427.1 DNA gyrase subunit A [Thermoclostridium caenicola]HPU22520.1 DNA gyrase subunit A [Thermoclostridium caenicola]